MALFTKQNFTPPVLSRKWIALKFRPNMLLYSHQHIISILESGLLFREDSVEVEQGAPSGDQVWAEAGGGKHGWMTKGEGLMATVAMAGCIIMIPPRSLQRSTLINITAYLAVPIVIRTIHRRACSGSALRDLLTHIREYLALARRAAACLKEHSALHTQLGSISTAIESTHTMLKRQQSELAVLMSRASSALLGNMPWLHADLAWDAVARDDTDSLQKIHHAFLVVQSTLLKHIAMAHFVPPPNIRKLYRNHNERIYWIHSVLIQHLNEEFKQNYETLDRMYRLLKNYGNIDLNVTKKPGTALNDSWFYSDVHSGIAKTSLELKLALNKCVKLDMFLDSCALNKQEMDLVILNDDIDSLIDDISKCLTSAQSSQLRLNKLKNKFKEQVTSILVDDDKAVGNNEDESILQIDDKEPEIKDEVFYFIKTDDDSNEIQPIGDISTGPGKKEKEATKVVLNELRRKLVKREDVMRERERRALLNTMPQFKDNMPEFPRQITSQEVLNRKGYISKIRKGILDKRTFRNYKISNLNRNKCNHYELKISKYLNQSDIDGVIYEANANLNIKTKLITVSVCDKVKIITEWCKHINTKPDFDSSGMSEGLSDVEGSATNKPMNQAININTHDVNQGGEAINFKFTKKDLELTPSSESDFEFEDKHSRLINDARKRRVLRKKKYSSRTLIDKDCADEGSKPIEYSFGTGMAIASVLQVNSKARMPNMMQEEIFMGDGEVSEDSGNDEDA